MRDINTIHDLPLSLVKDCPSIQETARSPQYPQKRTTLHFRPGDDEEPSLMGCLGSKEHRKLLEQKKQQPDVTKTDSKVNDFMARLTLRAAAKEIDLNVEKPAKPDRPLIPAGFSLDQLHTVLRPDRSNNKQKQIKSSSVGFEEKSKNFQESPNIRYRPEHRTRYPPTSNQNVSFSSSYEFDNSARQYPHKSPVQRSTEQHKASQNSTSGQSSNSDEQRGRNSTRPTLGRIRSGSYVLNNPKTIDHMDEQW